MGAKSNFWLCLHDLHHCLLDEGDTSEERVHSLRQALDAMQPVSQREVTAEFLAVLADLTVLHAEITADLAHRLPPQAPVSAK